MPLSDTKGNGGRSKEGASSKNNPARGLLGRTSSDDGRKNDATKQAPNATKRTNRVMAAVAALNGKTKRTDANDPAPLKLDPRVVDAEFEAVLVSLSNPFYSHHHSPQY